MRTNELAAKPVHRKGPARNRASAKEKTQPGAGEPIVHLRALADELNGAVTKCLDDADKGAVHHVRTGSRRVEAMLETAMHLYSAGKSHDDLQAGADKWLRQLKKIRRAAGKVRDLDVHRDIVARRYLKPEGNEPQADPPAGIADQAPSTPGSQAPVQDQAQKLDSWLSHHRKKQATKLVQQLGKRQTRLISAEQRCVAELEKGAARSRQKKPVAVLALESFLRLVDAMPVLDHSNLHDFRKGAKKARYVAETGEEDEEAKAIAKATNRVQDAIGEWHDFLMLGEEAGTALGKHAELRGEIDAETERLYSQALHTAEVVKQSLVGEWIARSGHPKAAKDQTAHRAAGL